MQTRPLRHRGRPRPGARRLGGVGGPVPRGRERRGGPGPRRLPRPAAGRARAERRRRRRPRGGAGPAAARARRGTRCGPPTPARRWTPPGSQGLATLRASAKRDEDGERRPLRRRLRRRPGGQRRAGGAVARTAACGSAPSGTRAEVAALPGARRRAGPARGSGARAAAAVAGRGDAARRVRHRGRAAAARRRPRGGRGRRWPTCRPTCCSRCPGLSSVEVVRRRRRAARSAERPVRRPRSGSPTADGRRSWQVAQRSGELPAALLADRPVEERVPPRLDGHLGGARWTTTASRARCRPARSCTRRRPATSRCRCRCG